MTPKHCKSCKITKMAKYSHTIKSGNLIFVDEKGRLWKGSVCPDCQAVIRRFKRRNIPKVESLAVNPTEVSPEVKNTQS